MADIMPTAGPTNRALDAGGPTAPAVTAPGPLAPPEAPEETLVTTAAEERVSVASQGQRMWWRFRKHKLAMLGAITVLLFYLVVVFADFLAYADPETSDAQRGLIAPQEIHWFDEGRFSPHVYA